eukprot:369245-Ditylum_brightwellii.AAC.1
MIDQQQVMYVDHHLFNQEDQEVMLPGYLTMLLDWPARRKPSYPLLKLLFLDQNLKLSIDS